MPRIIPSWTWRRPLYNHNHEEDSGKNCVFVKCQYILPDKSICGKPGCLKWWKVPHQVNTSDIILKELVVQHGHYLVDSYAQRRNTAHVVIGTHRRAKEDELIRTVVLKNNLKISNYLLEDFQK